LAARAGSVWSVVGTDTRPAAARSVSEADDAPFGSDMPDGFMVTPDAPFVVLAYEVELAAGTSWSLRWVQSLGSSEAEARAVFDEHASSFEARLAGAQQAWQEEWRAAFTPDSGRYSGYLPVLRTPDEKLKRLYYMAVLTLLYCKRTPCWGGLGVAYATGMPSSHFTFPVTWVFPWDTKMVAGVLALLDPRVLRGMIERWLAAGLHDGCAVDFVTGEPAGCWYAVNDYALIHMAYQYVRYTGDSAWLDTLVSGRAVREHLLECAQYYRHLAGEDGLADYGGAENLLECVSSYTHKVASFNAANVWNARTVADLLSLGRTDERAEALRQQADRLAASVQTLYVAGEGVWACLQPDGSRVPVRHCLDFFTVMQCMHQDLRAEQRSEMVAFFLRELKTETWMHALSPLDPDCASSSRTDHQDEGAYTTWPAYSLEVLLSEGYVREALAWIGCGGGPGLADVTRQGPFGQAYCHGEEGSPRMAGAGAKAPIELPHIEKPVLLSGGRYAQLVIEALAGLSPELDGRVTLEPPALPFSLVLDNLRLGGRNYCLRAA
ncbi:MAG TPA: hypothetical protein VF171_03615, partial [Trueperaceae bacterium]